MHKILFILSALTLLMVVCACSGRRGGARGADRPSQTRLPPAPVAPRMATTTPSVAGVLTDDFGWLRRKDSAEVLAYLKAENDYTARVLAPTKSLQAKLVEEFMLHTKLDDTSVPYPRDGWLYFETTDEKSDYPRYYRKRNDDDPPQLLLDLNELAKGREYVGLGDSEPSDDGRLYAYTLDDSGFRQYKLAIKDIDSGRLLPDTADRVTSLCWANDGQTLFYTTENDAKRSDKVWRHRLGGRPQLVFEEKDEHFNVAVTKTTDKTFVVITSYSYASADARVIAADKPTDTPRPIAPRRADVECYVVSHRNGEFFIRVNDTGRNFRLVTLKDDALGDLARATELIPHRTQVFLEDVNAFANHVVLSERAEGLPRLSLFDPATKRTDPIPMPEPVYVVTYGHNEVFDTDKLRFGYQSLVTPGTVYECDMDTKSLTVIKREEVPGGYDPTHYEQRMMYAPARDGTQIPVSLVSRKGLAGPRPLLLDVYGAYGLPEWVWFEPERISLLDRGVTFAIAHVRGGGELGKVWHDGGRLMSKTNTFGDVIDAVTHLQQQGVTAPDRTVISGASAGGMAVGAVLNLRPELFKAAVLGVPFVDVMNTMLDASLPLTTQEYLEWGDPRQRPAFDYMMSYSPYDNLKRQAYPSTLVVSSYNDSQVMYWEPAKYVAKLRTLKTDANPLLLNITMTGGHGGPSGRTGAFEQTALQYAFVLWQLGIAD